MNRTLTSLLMAFAAMLAVSCSDDDEPKVPQIADITFTAANPSFNNSEVSHLWRVREGIRFFSSDGPDAQAYYLSRSNEPVATAEFRYDRGGDITLWQSFAAFHGYGYGALEHFEAKVNQTQKFIPGTIDAEEDMLVSPVYNVADIDFSQPVNISLRRISAIINLRVTASADILKGDTITAVRLDTKNPANNFAGSLYINFNDGSISRAAGNTFKEAVAAGDGIAVGSGYGQLLISVLPTSLKKDDILEITLTTKAGRTIKKTKVLDDDLNIASNTFNNLTVDITDADF